MYDQETFEEIYYMASLELPNNIYTFEKESAILYKGFKISKTKHKYYWQDMRYSDYYEVVDKLITDNILCHGFCDTLTKVMIHNDTEKLDALQKTLINIDYQTKFWTNKSQTNWNKYRDQKHWISASTNLSDSEKITKLRNLEGKYNKNKELFHKKREILKYERINISADILFYESRLKTK